MVVIYMSRGDSVAIGFDAMLRMLYLFIYGGKRPIFLVINLHENIIKK